ncbi:MAG: cadaverine/lysine antiporter, partial [Enterobacterales bacterium]|nr:cadaverine/lysine antiporter [Enterobacterales bacterium]
RNIVSVMAATLGCIFCFIALSGAENIKLTATFIISLSILMFYARKQGEHEKAYAVQLKKNPPPDDNLG